MARKAVVRRVISNMPLLIAPCAFSGSILVMMSKDAKNSSAKSASTKQQANA
ncbi:hypothetical protein [Nissabacter sp. SGAir0207]|uniref:hypothetical protein n=1 Tax=Nissabacter sp. SGAir0207 TaxID=2126321 RepID=UPI00143CD2E2|nr:hypothetical protein [Nissabacter sp. SGAir0207]